MCKPTKLAIVADDLTGLQAIASEFAKLGLKVRTTLQVRDLTLAGDPDVLGIDTHSRHLPASLAAAAVRSAVGGLRSLGVRYIYKQADSGMQGPLAAEIEAAMQEMGAPGVVFAPSCPLLRRVMQGARQRDEAGLDVDVAALWRAQTGNVPATCKAASWAELRWQYPSPVWLADAQSDAELRALASAAWPQPDDPTAQPWLLAGSVGLASALASRWRQRVPRPGARPVLVVAGSQQDQTRRQIEALVTSADARLLEVFDRALSVGEEHAWLEQANTSAHNGQHVVVSVRPRAVSTSTKGGGYPLIGEAARRTLNRNLLRLLRGLLGAGKPRVWAGVLIAGGNTAELVTREALRLDGMLLSDWLAPGVAAAIGELGDGDRLPLVTKAGTWGNTDVLLRGIEWIVASDLALAVREERRG